MEANKEIWEIWGQLLKILGMNTKGSERCLMITCKGFGVRLCRFQSGIYLLYCRFRQIAKCYLSQSSHLQNGKIIAQASWKNNFNMDHWMCFVSYLWVLFMLAIYECFLYTEISHRGRCQRNKILDLKILKI